MAVSEGIYLICFNCGQKQDAPFTIGDVCSCGGKYVFHDVFKEFLADDLLQILRLGLLSGESFEPPCKVCQDKNRRILETIHGLGYGVVKCEICDGFGVIDNIECPKCYRLGHVIKWHGTQ